MVVTPPGHDGGMDIAVVVEQVQQVAAVRADGAPGRESLEAAMRGVGRLEAWLVATKAALTSKLAPQVSFPEKTIADCTRGTTRDAIDDKARADTLDAAPSLRRRGRPWRSPRWSTATVLAGGRAGPSTWSWSTAHSPTAPTDRWSTGGSRSTCRTECSPN